LENEMKTADKPQYRMEPVSMGKEREIK